MRPVQFVADVAQQNGLVDLRDVLELLRRIGTDLDEDDFDAFNEFENDMIEYVQKYYSKRITNSVAQ